MLFLHFAATEATQTQTSSETHTARFTAIDHDGVERMRKRAQRDRDLDAFPLVGVPVERCTGVADVADPDFVKAGDDAAALGVNDLSLRSDELLGRKGRMLYALSAIGPGDMSIEGRPFRIDLD